MGHHPADRAPLWRCWYSIAISKGTEQVEQQSPSKVQRQLLTTVAKVYMKLVSTIRVKITYLQFAGHLQQNNNIIYSFDKAICGTHVALMPWAWRPSVRPPVRPTVTLVNSDHIVQKMWQSTNDRIGRSFSYLHAKADPDRNIVWFEIPLWKRWPLLK